MMREERFAVQITPRSAIVRVIGGRCFVEVSPVKRLGKLQHWRYHARLGRLYRPSEMARLHPEVPWPSESKSASAKPSGRPRRQSKR